MLKLSLEERKDYIANIATAVFSAKGYQTANLQDIARKAKISKAGIYHYFKTKSDILAYIFLSHSSKFLSTLNRSLKDSRDKELDPEESFKELVKVYANYINENRDYRLLNLRERHQLTGRYRTEIYKREQNLFRLLKKELGNIPNLNSKININIIAFLFISMSHWLGYWLREDGELNLKEIIEQNIGAIFNGILKR